MPEITLSSLNETLDALVTANPHARSKGDNFKQWFSDNFHSNARISYIKSQQQTTNRVSEQFRYFNPTVVFVCSDNVKRESLIKYILERVYDQLESVAIIGVEFPEGGSISYIYEKLIVFRESPFSEWASPFFESTENGRALLAATSGADPGMGIPSSQGAKFINRSRDINTFTNVILYGPPGTGKTYKLQDYKSNLERDDDCYMVTFHQSFSYEEFIEGIKPEMISEESVGEQKSGGEIRYIIESGIFKKACDAAAVKAGYESLEDCLLDSKEGRKAKFGQALNEGKFILLCIDEINRGNVASIFGELISLIEAPKRLGAKDELTAILPYSKEEFGVPANLKIVGTMNTADRSIQLLDTAIRRRFEFEEMLPDYSLHFNSEYARNILKRINSRLRCILNKDSQIGHSYLMHAYTAKEIVREVIYRIIPLLEEYFYNDVDKVRFVLNEDKNTKYPFYIEDEEAKADYESFVSLNDIEEDDKNFFEVDRSIAEISDEGQCLNYIKHLMGLKEDE